MHSMANKHTYVTIEEADAYYIKSTKELTMSDESIDIIFDHIVMQSELAVCLNFEDEQIWIPKLLIVNIDDLENPECDYITIPLWFAEKEELEGYEL